MGGFLRWFFKITANPFSSIPVRMEESELSRDTKQAVIRWCPTLCAFPWGALERNRGEIRRISPYPNDWAKDEGVGWRESGKDGISSVLANITSVCFITVKTNKQFIIQRKAKHWHIPLFISSIKMSWILSDVDCLVPVCVRASTDITIIPS